MVGMDVLDVEAKDADNVAIVEDEDIAETACASAEQAAPVLRSGGHKKRRLYRQATGSEVPWFPHDNDSELLKELCHEAGRPRWVYFGTPAGGAGIHGCMEIGCSVIALCYDAHHLETLGSFFVKRAVEAMLSSTSMVFRNEDLVSKGKQLRLADTKESCKNGLKQDKKKDEEEEEEKEEKEEKEEEKKVKKKGGKAKAKKRKQSSSDESDESSSTEETEEKEEKKTPTKKRKKKA